MMRKCENKFKTFLRKISTAQIIVLVFLAVILLGSVLLSLPAACASGHGTDFLTCLFTATSATCVTGLSLVETGTYWSGFGKTLILLMIQIGGLGFPTIVAVFYQAMRRRVGLKQRMLLSQALSMDSLEEIPSFVKNVLFGTLLVEAVGAVLLTVRFSVQFDFLTALRYGVFHSVSAFCNAGFDILGDVEAGGSLSAYVGDPVVNLTVMALVVIGGVGFIVWGELRKKRSLCRLSLYAKMVLTITAALLVGGAVLYGILEWNNPLTLGNLNPAEKVLAACFESVTLRTAGFCTFPQADMTEAGKAAACFWMLIGGSSGSTAGGLKTVTMGVALLSVWSSFRRRSTVTLRHHSLSEDVVSQAITLLLSMLGLTFFGAVFLSAVNGCGFVDALFETTSALATVGLTAGLTGTLNTVSKLLIIVYMFFGRVGIVTISLGFMVSDRAAERYRYAEARVLIG